MWEFFEKEIRKSSKFAYQVVLLTHTPLVNRLYFCTYSTLDLMAYFMLIENKNNDNKSLTGLFSK